MKTNSTHVDDRHGLGDLAPEEIEAVTESTVTEMFREVLLLESHEPLPVDRNFFDLGLTSLALTNLRRRLEAELGVDLDSTVLFNRPTITDLVDYLVERLHEQGQS